MVSTLGRRVERLETSFGGRNSCPRCKDTIIVIGTDGEISVTKNGSSFRPEAAVAFHREEMPDGQCPRCGNIRHKVRVGWGQLR